MLTAQIGLVNPTDYWSTARSGGRDGLGIVNPTDYWSTARSGGRDGLGAAENEKKTVNLWVAAAAIVGVGIGGFLIGKWSATRVWKPAYRSAITRGR